MAKRKPNEAKIRERMIEKAYYESCAGIQINIMDISKVFAVGNKALSDGADYDTLKTKIREFVETIRQN